MFLNFTTSSTSGVYDSLHCYLQYCRHNISYTVSLLIRFLRTPVLPPVAMIHVLPGDTVDPAAEGRICDAMLSGL